MHGDPGGLRVGRILDDATEFAFGSPDDTEPVHERPGLVQAAAFQVGMAVAWLLLHPEHADAFRERPADSNSRATS
jgi:hypothetical protein